MRYSGNFELFLVDGALDPDQLSARQFGRIGVDNVWLV